MNRSTNGLTGGRSRGTILVASRSPAFLDIVGEMILDCGFFVATPAQTEAAWLSVTRTRPALVISDTGEPAEYVKELIAESLARRIPLLVLGMADDQASARVGSLPHGIAWLPFPLARGALQSAIDGLLNPAPVVAHHVVLAGAGVEIDAGFATRTLDDLPPRHR
jgi:DNA-binding response OmpR family regulator